MLEDSVYYILQPQTAHLPKLSFRHDTQQGSFACIVKTKKHLAHGKDDHGHDPHQPASLVGEAKVGQPALQPVGEERQTVVKRPHVDEFFSLKSLRACVTYFPPLELWQEKCDEIQSHSLDVDRNAWSHAAITSFF